MQTLEDLRTELSRYIHQTEREVAFHAEALANGEIAPDDIEGFRAAGEAFRVRHEAAAAALGQLWALEASTLEGLLQQWTTHADWALREIAHTPKSSARTLSPVIQTPAPHQSSAR